MMSVPFLLSVVVPSLRSRKSYVQTYIYYFIFHTIDAQSQNIQTDRIFTVIHGFQPKNGESIDRFCRNGNVILL